MENAEFGSVILPDSKSSTDRSEVFYYAMSITGNESAMLVDAFKK